MTGELRKEPMTIIDAGTPSEDAIAAPTIGELQRHLANLRATIPHLFADEARVFQIYIDRVEREIAREEQGRMKREEHRGRSERVMISRYAEMRQMRKLSVRYRRALHHLLLGEAGKVPPGTLQACRLQGWIDGPNCNLTSLGRKVAEWSDTLPPDKPLDFEASRFSSRPGAGAAS